MYVYIEIVPVSSRDILRFTACQSRIRRLNSVGQHVHRKCDRMPDFVISIGER